MTGVLFNVGGVPPAVHAALRKEAQEREVGLQQVAVEILAKSYDVSLDGMEYSRTRPPKERKQEVQMMLRVPQALSDALWVESRGSGLTQSSCAVRVIAGHYGIPYEPRRRGFARKTA